MSVVISLIRLVMLPVSRDRILQALSMLICWSRQWLKRSSMSSSDSAWNPLKTHEKDGCLLFVCALDLSKGFSKVRGSPTASWIFGDFLNISGSVEVNFASFLPKAMRSSNDIPVVRMSRYRIRWMVAF